jgi:hypothetical protein
MVYYTFTTDRQTTEQLAKNMYKGYLIGKAKDTGGKAGKGRNKTSTLQVFVLAGGRYWKCKQFVFEVGNRESYQGAIDKAREWIDNNPAATVAAHYLPYRESHESLYFRVF